MAETGVRLEVPPTSKSIAYNGPAPVITMEEQCNTAKLKTIGVLMGWPIVHITVDKIQKCYEGLKSSSKLFNWSCEVSNKLVTSLYDRSGPVFAAVGPVIRVADSVASDIVETLQKKLPVVRQPPSEVYDAMKSGVCKVAGPLWDKIDFIATFGERRLRRIAITSTRIYRKFAVALDKWMDDLERGLEKSRSKGLKGERVAGASSIMPSLETKLLLPVAVAYHWTMAVAMFSIGATAWAVSRLPVVGQFVSLSPSPSSSKSASPASDKDIKSSSSSYESIPEAAGGQTAVKMRRSMLNLERQGLD